MTPLAEPSTRVAAAQIRSTPDVAANLETVRAWTSRAADAGARLVVFPEATMTPFGTDLVAAAQPLDGPFAEGVRAVAAELAVTLVVGMFEPADAGRVFNTLLVTGPGVESFYRKIHLYDAFGARESSLVAPGSDLVTVEADGLRIGLATCYDLRFADQFTALGRAGAELICVPASWGEGSGKAAQWELMVRARAADAQAWLLACGQAWTAPRGKDALGIGNSALVDALGTLRATLTGEPGLLVGDVDAASVAAVRERLPILSPPGR